MTDGIDLKDLGSRVRVARSRLGMSQAALARLLEQTVGHPVRQQTVARIEDGNRTRVTVAAAAWAALHEPPSHTLDRGRAAADPESFDAYVVQQLSLQYATVRRDESGVGRIVSAAPFRVPFVSDDPQTWAVRWLDGWGPHPPGVITLCDLVPPIRPGPLYVFHGVGGPREGAEACVGSFDGTMEFHDVEGRREPLRTNAVARLRATFEDGA